MPTPSEEHPLRPVPRYRYRDFQVAGEGAMGLVYLALDTELNREVAFKIVRPGGGEGGGTPATPLDASAPPAEAAPGARFAALKARFLQEAWVTGGMEHPGIVPVYELGQTEGGVPYYTMRFVRGQRTLKDAIDELAQSPFEDRLAILEPFLKLCDAVSYAHAQGVIHRDLKPANIALGQFGEVVVLDWGLAKLRGKAAKEQPAGSPSTPKGFQTDEAALGTPGYIPPEAVRGGVRDLDDRSDVYSLGVILFQILTGRLPFPVEPFPEYLAGVTREEAPSAKALSPAVPDALDALCAHALRRSRGERLDSVRALADGVRQWQTQSARDREMEGLLREAKTALAAATDSKGPSRIRQTQRALEVLAAARRQRPESARVQRLQAEARVLRNQGIKETQRLSRRRLTLVGGVTLLALASIAAFVVAGMLNERRKQAEDANRATQAALDEARNQREAARRESLAARVARDRAEKEAARARNAYEIVSSLVGEIQQADREEGRRLAEVLDAGLDAAFAHGDADGVFLLLEQAREAGPLARAALGAATRGLEPPAELRDAEERARRETGRTHRAYLDARKGMRLIEVRRANMAVSAAREKHLGVLVQVLRSLEAQREAVERGPATLEKVQATLRPGDAFVSFGRVKGAAVAVVVQKSTKWIRELGDADRIGEAISQVRAAWRERRPDDAALSRLHDLVVAPLALPPSGGRVVVVPEGGLLILPFPLLLPHREVCTVPSAGTYLYLRTPGRSPSRAVLALAGSETGGVELPGARAEALGIGDETLIGGAATWRNLRAALVTSGPWRALHMGVDGSLAPAGRRSPHLALTPDEGDDGFLVPLEIALLDCRADLVVLSAASLRSDPRDLAGRALEVPQALLYAGARRVLFPTLDPDDVATRALMERFYALWNPRDDEQALDAATALARAQAFVRSHARWRDPLYWASWVLWGLPE